MVNAVNGVTSTKFVSQDGTVKEFKTMNATKDSKSQVSIMENGAEVVYSKIKVKNSDGKEEYKYVLFEEGKEVKPQTEQKDYDKLPGFMSLGETKWDRGVDAVTDGILGIDNSKATTDGKDDGNISGWDKFKHFCKGALAPVKNIIKHPFKTLGTGLLIGAALKGLATVGLGAVATVAGPVMLGVGLVAGLGTLAYGAIKASKATTDGDAKAAWENMGTGTITAALSAIGLRRMYKASHAKAEAFPNDARYKHTTPQEDLKAQLDAKIAARDQAIATRDTLREKSKLAKKIAELKFARNGQRIQNQDTTNLDKQLKNLYAKWQAKGYAGNPGKIAGPTLATNARNEFQAAQKALGPLHKECNIMQHKLDGLSQKPEFGGLAGKIQSVKAKVKDKFTLNSHKDLITSVKDNKMEGLRDAASWRIKQAGFGMDLSKADMSTVEALNAQARNHILNGSHYKAKSAIDQMKLVLGSKKVTGDNATQAQQWIDELTTLSKTTKILHKAPGWKTVNVIGANIANATDDSATAYSKLKEGAYTVATAS